MKDILVGFLPDKIILVCTVIAFAAPYSVYKVNQKLHENGDPAWKRQEKEDRKPQAEK